MDNDDFAKIQVMLNWLKIQYNLLSLTDRRGNIVLKFPVEIFSHKPISLSPERGVAGVLYYNGELELNCHFQIIS